MSKPMLFMEVDGYIYQAVLNDSQKYMFEVFVHSLAKAHNDGNPHIDTLKQPIGKLPSKKD